MFTGMNTMVSITLVQQQIKIKENKNTEQAQQLVTLNLKKQLIFIGFDNFNCKVLETINYSNINELWALDDKYITLYNSSDNGFNSRFNKERIS